MDRCTEFINKVRESRFIKVRDRQVNKFNRLMGYKDRGLTAQPPVNTAQLQVPSKPNKWIIKLSSTPLSQCNVTYKYKYELYTMHLYSISVNYFPINYQS